MPALEIYRRDFIRSDSVIPGPFFWVKWEDDVPQDRDGVVDRIIYSCSKKDLYRFQVRAMSLADQLNCGKLKFEDLPERL